MHGSGLMQSIASTVHAVSGSAVSRGDRAPSESIRGTAFCPSAHSRWCGQCQLELEPPVKKMMRKCSVCAKGFPTQEDLNIHLMMRHKNQNRKNSDDSVCFDFNKSIDFIIKQTLTFLKWHCCPPTCLGCSLEIRVQRLERRMQNIKENAKKPEFLLPILNSQIEVQKTLQEKIERLEVQLEMQRIYLQSQQLYYEKRCTK